MGAFAHAFEVMVRLCVIELPRIDAFLANPEVLAINLNPNKAPAGFPCSNAG